MLLLGWIMILAAVIVMVRVAEAEDRSPILWGAVTLLLCLGAGMLIPLPLVNIFLGFAASFLMMFAMNAATGP
jgi:hypothetical protein